jgi:oxaloacetate decarboxylase alpha subunit
MAVAMRAARATGAHVQATISYTLSPVHSTAAFVALGQELASLGADSICIKDMAGLIAPYDAFELVSRLKSEVGLPVQLHCHYTSGMATAAYLKAAEAGVDVVDTAISSLSQGSSQPPTETIVSLLRGTPRDTGLDLTLLTEISRYFAIVRKRYRAFEGDIAGVDTNVLTYQIPGGMISNLVSQLREQDAGDRLPEVLVEVPRVRADLGYPPLVTPTSQIVGTQAVLNVITGQRYKVIPKEVRAYVLGMYGRPPAPIDAEVQRLILGEQQPILGRPADALSPELPKAAAELGSLARSEEDVVSYALYPQITREFLERRSRGVGIDPATLAAIATALAAARPPIAAPPPPPESAWKQAGRARVRSGWAGLR